MPADIWTSEDGERFLSVGSDDNEMLVVLIGAKYVGCIHFTPAEARQLAEAILGAADAPSQAVPPERQEALAEALEAKADLCRRYEGDHVRENSPRAAADCGG